MIAVLDTEAASVENIECSRTMQALNSLPPRLQRILLLHDVHGLPMSEVATRLRLSRASADRRWARAVVLMSERLAKADEKAGR